MMQPHVTTDCRVPPGVVLVNPRFYSRVAEQRVEYHPDGSATIHITTYAPVVGLDYVIYGAP